MVFRRAVVDSVTVKPSGLNSVQHGRFEAAELKDFPYQCRVEHLVPNQVLGLCFLMPPKRLRANVVRTRRIPTWGTDSARDHRIYRDSQKSLLESQNSREFGNIVPGDFTPVLAKHTVNTLFSHTLPPDSSSKELDQ